MNTLKLTTTRTDSQLARYEKFVGLDVMYVLLTDPEIRNTRLDTVVYLSFSDLMDRFAPEGTKNLRSWRNDEKKRLLVQDNELSEIFRQLKMMGKDGKLRKMDAIPLWGALVILSRIDSDSARYVIKQIFKSVASKTERSIEDLQHAAQRVASSEGWASETVHQIMLENGLLDNTGGHDSPDEEIGYRR